MHIGAELGLTNWLSALVLGVTAGLAYAHRVRVEERALRASLGESHEEYMRRTTRFIPFVF